MPLIRILDEVRGLWNELNSKLHTREFNLKEHGSLVTEMEKYAETDEDQFWAEDKHKLTPIQTFAPQDFFIKEYKNTHMHLNVEDKGLLCQNPIKSKVKGKQRVIFRWTKAREWAQRMWADLHPDLSQPEASAWAKESGILS